jgi:hypothetical protein
MESVVPGLSLTPQIGNRVWLEDETDNIEDAVTSEAKGEWVTALGFGIGYRFVYDGFENACSGSEQERVLSAALQLMSRVQDIVAETTGEPWPLVVVNNRKDMALPNAAIEANELHMWYGAPSAPALKLPSVHLV